MELEVEETEVAELDSFEEESTTESPLPPAVQIESPPLELQAQVDSTAARDSDRLKRERDAARSVFAAKRPWQKNKRNIQLAGLGIAAVLVIAIGSFFYINLSAPGGIGVNIDPNLVSQQSFTVPPSADPGADTDGTIATEPGIDAAEPDSDAVDLSDQTIVQVIGADDVVSDEPVAVETAPPQPLADAPDPQPGITTTTVATAEPEVETVEPATEPVAPAEDQEPAAPQNQISFVRRASEPELPASLGAAYSAYSSGNLARARQLYQQVLVEAPLNRDALLGVAAIATSENNRTEAMELYSRLLARDPSDPVARAGLLGLLPNGSLAEQERELRLLMERHPEVATIAFALGNFYASQQRWSNAQQYYFNALSLAKTAAVSGGQVNPDYAFNLAVSLEHLNQLQPARSYYQEALQLAANYPAGFDLGVARSRLADLNRTEGP